MATLSTGPNNIIDPNTSPIQQLPLPPVRGASRPTAQSNRASIAVACVACRNRHLKCDGSIPCTRCIAEGGAGTCSYVKSRRGWKGPRRNRTQPAPDDARAADTSSTSPNSDTQSRSSGSNAGLVSHGLDTSVTLANGNTPPGLNFNSPISPREFSLATLAALPAHASLDPSTSKSAFFTYFATSHPFLPPLEQTLELIRDNNLTHLDLAIQFLGSFYIPSAPKNQYKENLSYALLHQNFPKDGFAVQALLLLALGLHFNGEEDPATQALYMAMSVALEIGMQHAQFATTFGAGSRTLEESWRRTWWELFVTNGMFAGVNRKVIFKLRDVIATTHLPCEERQFSIGDIPEPMDLASYDDSPFAGDDTAFSSFAYLVDAVRVLGKVIAIDVSDPFQLPNMEAAESCLTNWRLHLPADKREVINRDGVVDEVLLRAHMIVNAASIMLHRPRSTIGSSEVQEITTCAPQGQHVLPTQTLEFHTAKAMQAAEDISKLITLPSPLPKRTPFFTCAIVMAAVVHLSYWSFIVPDGEDHSIKELIKLDTGALKSLAKVWPISIGCLGQVKGVAHEMFTSKKAMSLHLWNSISGDEILQRIIEDAGIEDLPR